MKKELLIVGLTALLTSCANPRYTSTPNAVNYDWREVALSKAFGKNAEIETNEIASSFEKHHITGSKGSGRMVVDSNNELYIDDYMKDSQELTLRIEGTHRHYDKTLIPNEVTKCPKSSEFNLKPGERCYFTIDKGIAELYWYVFHEPVITVVPGNPLPRSVPGTAERIDIKIKTKKVDDKK